MRDGQRSFTIERSTVGVVGGRFTVYKTDIAARHAAKTVFREINRKDAPPEFAQYKGTATFDIELKETTMGSNNKLLYYRCTRVPVPIDKSLARATWLGGRHTLHKYKAVSIYQEQYGNSNGPPTRAVRRNEKYLAQKAARKLADDGLPPAPPIRAMTAALPPPPSHSSQLRHASARGPPVNAAPTQRSVQAMRVQTTHAQPSAPERIPSLPRPPGQTGPVRVPNF